MIPPRIGRQELGEIASGAIRDGFSRLARASEALASGGLADAAATVSISEEARRRAGPQDGTSELDALLELRRAGIQVEAGVAVLQSADDMAREALSIAARR
ncbi:MAG: hypothetical protein FJ096_16590 [Deltaproteobacteria bacterium]|nr:hypothetical protein [Deltaproteobacteria bacterium]